LTLDDYQWNANHKIHAHISQCFGFSEAMDLVTLKDTNCDELSGYQEGQQTSNLLTNLTANELTQQIQFSPGQASLSLSVVNPPPNLSDEQNLVIAKIEAIFESIADCLLQERRELTIELKSRPKRQYMKIDGHTGAIIDTSDGKLRDICFPAKTSHEAWKFSESRNLSTMVLKQAN
jgi:hypothetical protein